MGQSEVIAVSFLTLLVVLTGCTKEKRDNPLSSTGTSGAPTLSSIQQDIIASNCAISGCHDNRANPGGSLDLSTVEASYAGLVNRRSTQVNLMLVLPNDSEKSYLVDKLRGTQNVVGGSGFSMPQYAAQLKQADIERIVEWINTGAAFN